MQRNFCKLLILSFGFFLLFSVFFTAQSLASQVLDDLGFGDLGFYSLGVLYFAFAFLCFVATPIVNKCGERFCLTLGSLCYTTYVGAFILASASVKYPGQISDEVVQAVILITAAICGFGAAILWVAEGRYISRIADDANKGTFNSIFWVFFQASQLIGTLFAAIVLDNTDAFTFYCIMTATCFLASLFFLFLRPVESDTVEVKTTAKEDVKETCKLTAVGQMATLYPLMLNTAINLGVFGSIFIPMMVDTMGDDFATEKEEKTAMALYTMFGLGIGEMAGAVIFGRLIDKYSTRVTIMVEVLAMTFGYGFLFLYAAVYEFEWHYAFLMTVFWGVQDAGHHQMLNTVLGFQFESKTTPFSVCKFVQSLQIFIVFCIQSEIESQQARLIYFGICYVLSILAWLILERLFKFKSKEEVEVLRATSAKLAAVAPVNSEVEITGKGDKQHQPEQVVMQEDQNKRTE